MTEETTKSSTGRRNKSSIRSILSDNSSNTFYSHHPLAPNFGEAESTAAASGDSSNPSIPARRISEQERLRLRHTSFQPVYSESSQSWDKDIQDHLKRRKLSLIPQSFLTSGGGAEDPRDEPLSLNTEDDTTLRSFPVREYPRRLSIASVLTADSSSLPSVISPATTTSWAGLASSASSTTTANPPQWPFMSELYQPLSRRSPIPSIASASTAVGSHSRKDQQGYEDSDFRTWEFDIETAPGRMKTPYLRNIPRRSHSDIAPFRDPTLAMAHTGGFAEGIPSVGSVEPGYQMEEELRDLPTRPPEDIMKLGESQQHTLEAYTDVVADLQHKLSTKTLALEALQKEHDRLLGAYSRQQTRSAAIQKKCTVADAEIVSLSAERDRLQEAFEQSETQVQELTEQRDSINKKFVARVKEYSSIVQLASQMENLSMAELKKWKDRDTMMRSMVSERDKLIEEMHQRLALAESVEEARMIPELEGDANQTVLLRRENQLLKQRVEELETSVYESKQEVERMEGIGRMLLHRNREGSDPSSQTSGPPSSLP
ncbi:hypothetical protein H072_2109 [Dactylellina haptotyla CBS 200.50]|uniref:Uncharacterized protein n=1 Tax=Dactylellina haptotyla (strain CBS 200.50) TaxID=1284197 RepID=S8ALX7_DACHA|nr:hypothetical protein H072_2109 [Dactylellina haptotyla CBS 200.50]